MRFVVNRTECNNCNSCYRPRPWKRFKCRGCGEMIVQSEAMQYTGKVWGVGIICGLMCAVFFSLKFREKENLPLFWIALMGLAGGFGVGSIVYTLSGFIWDILKCCAHSLLVLVGKREQEPCWKNLRDKWPIIPGGSDVYVDPGDGFWGDEGGFGDGGGGSGDG